MARMTAEDLRRNMVKGAGGGMINPNRPDMSKYSAPSLGLIGNPGDLGFFDLLKQTALQSSGLLPAYQKQQQDIASKQQVRDLIGSMRANIDQGQRGLVEEVDPATGETYTYEKSILPTTAVGSEALAADPANMAQLYSEMLTTPGYEQIGAQGMQGLIGSRQAARTAQSSAAKEAFDKEQKIRNEFRGETKTFIDINDAYGRIQASATDATPAGDLSMIFNYMKMLDPGSVVRESEFATAEGAASVPERFKGAYNKVVSGKKLTKTQRADFINRAGKLYNEALKGFGKRKETFEKLAESYSLDPTKATFARGIYDEYVASPETEKLLGAYRGQPQQQPRLGEAPPPPGFVRDK